MIIFKFHFYGTGEMAQCLKAIVTLAEDLNLLSNTHMMTHSDM